MVKRRKHHLWFEGFGEPQEMMNLTARKFFEEPSEFKFRFPPSPRSFPVDIAERDRELVAKADLPGFSKEDIRLKVTSNSIEISAEKKRQSIERTKAFFRQERSYGSASRFLSLPAEVKPEQAKARFENGVLDIILPKKEIRAKEKRTLKIE